MSSADQTPAADVRMLRELAGAGRLAAFVSAAAPAQYATLAAAAYEIAWPLVFYRITRPVERRRGHWRCSTAMTRLADDCLDGFHDDVEAVVADLLSNAKAEIANLEAWLSGRLTAATVDGHRRRRGQRGALQRPRLPQWLAAELGHDAWLGELALHILDWVGVPGTAGTGVWPLDTWALRRAAVTGDCAGSDHRTVLGEVNRVLAAMRRRPGWYADYVERPLGTKAAPVAAPPGDAVGDTRPLTPMTPEDEDDDRLLALASAAVDAIAAGLRRGEEPGETVVRVLGAVFGSGTGGGELNRVPGAGVALDERVSVLLADHGVRDRIVAQAVGIVARGD
ncbi:MAG TPA: hypothetical protein VFR35_13445 [Actinoplanes sp.]|nr:hypothetical protein [Actinoplanes sp.]